MSISDYQETLSYIEVFRDGLAREKDPQQRRAIEKVLRGLDRGLIIAYNKMARNPDARYDIQQDTSEEYTYIRPPPNNVTYAAKIVRDRQGFRPSYRRLSVDRETALLTAYREGNKPLLVTDKYFHYFDRVIKHTPPDPRLPTDEMELQELLGRYTRHLTTSDSKRPPKPLVDFLIKLWAARGKAL